MTRFLTGALAFTCAAARVAAPQQPTAPLSADSLREVVSALAHDSLEGRSTASAGLDKAAAYITRRFERVGLLPGGDANTFVAAYPLAISALEPGRAHIRVPNGDRWLYGYDWWYAGGGGGSRPPAGVREGPIVIVRGVLDSATVAQLPLRNRIVIYDMPRDARGRIERAGWRSVFRMASGGPAAVLLGTQRDAASFARIRADTAEHKRAALPLWDLPENEARPEIISFMPFLEVSDSLLRFFTSSRLQPLNAHVSYAELNQRIAIHFDRHVEVIRWVPNVIALLPGSDPLLRHEYVIYTAHYDGLGLDRMAPPGTDRIFNGADDNASGTALLLQTANALMRAPRPRRSIVVAALSGEEMGLLGSDYFASRLKLWNGKVVANINADMIGNARGTLYVLSSPGLQWAVDAAATTVRGELDIRDKHDVEKRWPGQDLDARSDHASFVRRGVPAVSLFTGLHERYHQTSDETAHVDLAGLSAAARFAFELGLQLANAPAR